MFAGSSLPVARFKLAHGLQLLSSALHNSENLHETSAPVLVKLAVNIDSAVHKLQNLPIIPLSTDKTTSNTQFKLVNGKAKKTSGPGPKSRKKGPNKNNSDATNKFSTKRFSASLNSDVGEKNNIWLIPKIQLTDVLKSKVIMSENNCT